MAIPPGPKNPHPVLRATGPLMGSGRRSDSFPLETFESAVFSSLEEVDPRELLDDEAPDEAAALMVELNRVEASALAIQADMDENGESPALFKRLRAKAAEQQRLAKRLAEAGGKPSYPELSASWAEAKTLLGTLESGPDQREARLRLRDVLRRIVEEIRILVVPRGRERFAVVQIWFSAGVNGVRHRDYLIHHVPALAAGHEKKVRRPSKWSVESLAFEDLPECDLRNPEGAATLEASIRRALGLA